MLHLVLSRILKLLNLTDQRGSFIILFDKGSGGGDLHPGDNLLLETGDLLLLETGDGILLE